MKIHFVLCSQLCLQSENKSIGVVWGNNGCVLWQL
jgi:hypothetical protein